MVAKQKTHWIPKRGDIVSIDLNPVKGHEQAGRRPGVVVSPGYYSQKSGLALVCPITTVKKEYPFEVAYEGKKSVGVVLVDQIRCVDIEARNIKFIESIDKKSEREIIAKLKTLTT